MNTITNNDTIGDFQVTVYAIKKPIATFQVRTMTDAITEANRIRKERAEKDLPTAFAVARKIVGWDTGQRTGSSRLLLGEQQHIQF